MKIKECAEIIIIRGVRQGGPISPMLFTAAIQEVFKNSQLGSRGIGIAGEKLRDLRFADDVALTTTTKDDMEVHFNLLDEIGKKVGLKYIEAKPNYDKLCNNSKN